MPPADAQDAEPGEQGEAGEVPENHDDAEDWIVGEMIAGRLSSIEAAERLGLSVGAVLRLGRERSGGERQHAGAGKSAEAPADSEHFAKNWEKVHGDSEPQPEELPALEAIIQSIPPARWLLGTERRRLFTAISACGLVALGVAATAYFDRKETAQNPVESPFASLSDFNLPDEGDYLLSDKVARAFLLSESLEERLELVRDRARVETLAKEWHRRGGHRFQRYDGIEFRKSSGTSINGIPFVIFEYISRSGEGRAIAVDVSGETPKVDWESFVHYQPMSWEQFKQSRPKDRAVRFRVRIQKNEDYYFPFDDKQRFKGYRLTAPDGIVGLNGFVERGSEEELRLDSALAGARRPVNVTLDLRFGDGAEPAVAIERVQEGWIQP